MKKEPSHGGARKGAGRPAGSGTAPPTSTRSIRLTDDLWAKLDRMTTNRSKWIAERIKKAKEP
jgi:hypothetical protein